MIKEFSAHIQAATILNELGLVYQYILDEKLKQPIILMSKNSEKCLIHAYGAIHPHIQTPINYLNIPILTSELIAEHKITVCEKSQLFI